jgi:hypothetical protein
MDQWLLYPKRRNTPLSSHSIAVCFRKTRLDKCFKQQDVWRFVFQRFTLSESSTHVRNFNVVQSYHDNIHTLLVSERNHLLCCVVLGAVYKFKVLLLQSGKRGTSVYSRFKDRMPQWLCSKITDILLVMFSRTSWKVPRQLENGMPAKEVFSLNFLKIFPLCYVPLDFFQYDTR